MYADAPKEFNVKAAFMVKLTHFIKWPDTAALPLNKNKFTICIEHTHKLKDSLSAWAQTGLIKNKPVSVKYIEHDAVQLAGCDMLYITHNERLNFLINSAKINHILTISDTPGNAKRGVLINFINKKNKLRFEINLGAAEKLGFKINPRVLKLATIVSSEETNK